MTPTRPRHIPARLGILLFLATALACEGCAHRSEFPSTEVVWQGEVHVRGREEIPANKTLVIRPGTRVIFHFLDEDGDGKGDAGLVVKGGISARGEERARIVFKPEEGSHAPGWNEIRVEGGSRATFSDCSFTGAQWAIHAHLTPVLVTACVFDKNEGGIKFRGGPVEIRNTVFLGNTTAVRYWEGNPRIEGNIFRGNGTAIFCREGSPRSVIRGNNFLQSAEYHIKLGELQPGNVDARGNWWGTTREEDIERLLFDRADVSYLGKILYRPYEMRPLPLEDRRKDK